MNEITKVRMIIKDIFIKKKKDLVGKAEVFALAVVADDLADDPKITQTDIFEKIRKKTSLPIAGAGLVIYRNPNGKIPNKLDFKIVVTESDKRVRATGNTVEGVTGSEAFKKIKGAAIKSAVAAPQVAIATVAVEAAFKVITAAFKMNQDDQMMLIEGSYDKDFDELGASAGLVTQENKYVRLQYEVQVKREEVV